MTINQLSIFIENRAGTLVKVLDILKQNKDSLLHQADQPPYIIEVKDER